MTPDPDAAIPETGDEGHVVISRLADRRAQSGQMSRRQPVGSDARCDPVTWTFHQAEGSEMSLREQTEHAASELKQLEHREAELVRRVVVLSERHAFFPNEVSERQVRELSRKLDELRARIDSVRAELPPRRAS